MTEPQQATIHMLRERGYTVHPVKTVRDGILRIIVKRKLTDEWMPLRINRDGTYMCPLYDTRNHNRRKDEAWQS